MLTKSPFPLISCFLAGPALAADVDFSQWRIEETSRFEAPEARQGVAVDDRFIYVIGNQVIGKYDKQTFELQARWSGQEDSPIIHFNAGIVVNKQLAIAHSNYPEVPMTGSVEFFDTESFLPVGSQSFGAYFGSVTWALPFDDGWLVCFAHYGNKAAEPNRDPTWTNLVHFDQQWRRTGGWVFPNALFDHIGGNYSLSGGAFGPEGLLYVSGHDAPELHVLRFPDHGSEMQWLATIDMPAAGQAFAWDPYDPERFYGIVKSDRQVIVGRLMRNQPADD